MVKNLFSKKAMLSVISSVMCSFEDECLALYVLTNVANDFVRNKVYIVWSILVETAVKSNGVFSLDSRLSTFTVAYTKLKIYFSFGGKLITYCNLDQWFYSACGVGN